MHKKKKWYLDKIIFSSIIQEALDNSKKQKLNEQNKIARKFCFDIL